jgi:SET domain-containing protein
MSWRPPAEPYFEIRRSGIQGRGAFAVRPIRKGTRIIEYTGERISQDEGDRRYVDDEMGRHHTFLFDLDDGTVVDGAVGGSDARFINHSCDPNCETIIEGTRIFVDAIRTIRPGEELVYDYKYERTSDHTEEDEKLYMCRCGAESCRGTILAPPKPKKKRKRKSQPRAKKKGTATKRKTKRTSRASR